MGRFANILFPADYFDKKAPDGAMRAGHDAAVAVARFDVGLFDLKLFDERGMVVLTRPFLDPSLPLLYRGWMMKPRQYSSFYDSLCDKGLYPIVAPEHYSEFHMFPLAYERHEALRSHSPKLLAFEGESVDAGIVDRAFSRFMVKDYVKSVKGTSFPQFFETPIAQESMDAIVAEFIERRGGLFTEGIACKEYVELARYGGATNEWRAFYLMDGLLNLCRNSNQPASVRKPPEDLVASCANLGSPYYTVDFAECADGSWTVVETGDGQVSGPAAAQDPVMYYQMMADALERGL